jgi:hypothetical protein
MQKGREVRDLRARQVELRHPFVGTAGGQELGELLASFIGLHHHRARQVGSSRAAAGVGAVAEAALIDVQSLSAFDRRRIGDRRERLLLGHRGGYP